MGTPACNSSTEKVSRKRCACAVGTPARINSFLNDRCQLPTTLFGFDRPVQKKYFSLEEIASNAEIIRSRTSRGVKRSGALLGSTRDRNILATVDFALPASWSTNPGNGPLKVRPATSRLTISTKSYSLETFKNWRSSSIDPPLFGGRSRFIPRGRRKSTGGFNMISQPCLPI